MKSKTDVLKEQLLFQEHIISLAMTKKTDGVEFRVSWYNSPSSTSFETFIEGDLTDTEMLERVATQANEFVSFTPVAAAAATYKIYCGANAYLILGGLLVDDDKKHDESLRKRFTHEDIVFERNESMSTLNISGDVPSHVLSHYQYKVNLSGMQPVPTVIPVEHTVHCGERAFNILANKYHHKDSPRTDTRFTNKGIAYICVPTFSPLSVHSDDLPLHVVGGITALVNQQDNK